MKGLGEWRNQIDRLDREVVSLLNRRAECVLGLAPLKRRRGLSVLEPTRESAVLGNIQVSNRGPLPNKALERIYKVVLEEMRAMQRRRDD